MIKNQHYFHSSNLSNMLPSKLALPALILLAFILVLSFALLRPKQRKDARKQPPGPPAWPVIGNLHMLGALPHRTLQAMARKYGPIMSLSLGQVPTIVVSSADAAEQFLKTHDTIFASRPKFEATKYLFYDSKGMVFCEYGPYWRNMRKVCTIQLLSALKVDSFSPLRKQELELVVKALAKAAEAREVVDLSEVVEHLTEDITYKMVLGYSRDDKFDLKGLIQEGLKLAGAFNVADFVPWLRAFDLQGLRRGFKKTSKALDEVLEKIVKEHEQASWNEQNGCRHHKDFIDILLSLMHQSIDPYDDQNHVIDRTNIKAVVLDMIGAAFETSATATLWALSELLRHPKAMRKLQNELETVVGMNKLVEEIDLAKLSYLDMVIKETLRLYPAGPLLFRESNEDVMIDDYLIKKKTRILVNVWAIGRDPKVWSANAETFYPERFINNNVDIKGQDFRLIPFGSGRRGCPGILLGLTTVKLVLAQLVHCFSWELPPCMKPDDLDMNEIYGLTIPRAKHLLVVPTYRIRAEGRK